MVRFIAQLSALRKQNRVFSRGTPAILQDNGNLPGILAYSMAYAGSTAIVVINTLDTDTLTARFAPGLPVGSVLIDEIADGAAVPDLVVAADGTVIKSLLLRSAYVWLAAAGS
ncbi:hypothetical protein [Paraburkholderia elongata]|uniref:Uncharacterized protein n=1 Tax=Paraburkholderia elongata TaxID=2675747 RepID=A0A972NQK7_9BURK|nr:hypothetical protein [Paraburkholderia elongata]NPT55850.1 hypothetical protein [Paraburkholderia elongata]